MHTDFGKKLLGSERVNNEMVATAVPSENSSEKAYIKVVQEKFWNLDLCIFGLLLKRYCAVDMSVSLLFLICDSI